MKEIGKLYNAPLMIVLTGTSVPEGDPIVVADPDDDVFLRCATAASAAYVISGDHHLLDLGGYAGIPILTVHDFFAREFPDRID
jgi:predicted nucleic acid-binding protein